MLDILRPKFTDTSVPASLARMAERHSIPRLPDTFDSAINSRGSLSDAWIKRYVAHQMTTASGMVETAHVIEILGVIIFSWTTTQRKI